MHIRHRMFLLVAALLSGSGCVSVTTHANPAAASGAQIRPEPSAPHELFEAATPSTSCTLDLAFDFQHSEIGAIPVYRLVESGTYLFTSRMHVNADGAPDAYHPTNDGTIHLCNGIQVGRQCTWKADCMPEYRQALLENFSGPTKICFFAMATDEQGRPLIQGVADPNPGYYISTTALSQPGKDRSRPEGQLDSNTVPFAVIPRSWNTRTSELPKLGDFGVALRKSSGQHTFFVVGDIGPNQKLGEGSIALHQALGNNPFVQRYGKRRASRSISGRDVLYLIFPGSADRALHLSEESISDRGGELLDAIGGIARLRACADTP